MTTTKLYNSFPRISYQKKITLINFIHDYQEGTTLNIPTITHLMDYALKEISSFGGFVVTEEKETKLLGIMIVNNTGMEGYMPKNLIVASAFLPTSGKEGSKKRILQKIMHTTRGEAALFIKNPHQQKHTINFLNLKTVKMMV